MLSKIFSTRQFEIFFLFFPEIRLWLKRQFYFLFFWTTQKLEMVGWNYIDFCKSPVFGGKEDFFTIPMYCEKTNGVCNNQNSLERATVELKKVNISIIKYALFSVSLRGWSGGAKVSCILCHRGVQLILAYSWARPAILVAGKGRGGMFLFLLFLHFHSCSSFFPVPLFHLFDYLFYHSSPFLWETTQNDPQGLTCR